MTFFYDLNARLNAIADKPVKQNLTEGAKPDFLDLDRDGNKKEPMKSAAKSAPKSVEEVSYSAKAARAGKDIGKPGKQFAQIAKSAGERYGSKERGEKVAGAVLAKLRGQNESVEEGVIPPEHDRAKKVTIPAYQRKAQGGDWKTTQRDLDKDRERNISDRKGMARLRGIDPDTVDEGWDDMIKAVHDRASKPKIGDIERGAKHDIKHTATGRMVTRRTDDQGISVGADDDADADTPKRGRGRPKGTGKSLGAKGPSGKSKLMTKEEIEEAIAALEEAGYSVQERKLSSSEKEEREDIVKGMKKNKAEFKKRYGDRAEEVMYATATKLAKERGPGNPDRKKKEKTEESGTSTDSPKGKSGVQFGKGIYDSFNRELEKMIAESMNVSMNMSSDSQGGPTKSLTVTATDEDAVYLGKLLKMAGMGGEGGCGCGTSPCSCNQMDEAYGDVEATENHPDYPTNTEVSDDVMQYAGGINKPKSTGQTTVPVIASQEERQVTAEDDAMGRTGDDITLGEEDALARMMEMAGVAKPSTAGAVASVAEAVPPADMQVDPQATAKYAEEIVDKLNSSFSTTTTYGFGLKYGQDGSVTIMQSHPGTIDPQYADMKGVVSPQNVSKVIDPYYNMFRQKGWRFDQPVGGEFTIAVPRQTMEEKDHDMDAVDAQSLDKLREMAGIAREQKTEEGNLFTGNLAKARAAGKKEADLDGDGDMEKVRESVTNLWKAYKG